MKKKRVEFGEDYYFIDITTQICCGCELHSGIESKLFDAGNYFTTKGEAEACVRKLRAVLAGADVIQLPSENEINQASVWNAYDHDGDLDYIDCEAERFIDGVNYLKSRIIK